MTQQVYKIPLTNIPQFFDISLKGVDYRMTCRWNDALEGGWFLDFALALTGEILVTNIPLTTGLDILEPYSYLGIGGSMVVLTDNDEDAVPNLDDLGTQSNLYFITEDGQ